MKAALLAAAFATAAYADEDLVGARFGAERYAFVGATGHYVSGTNGFVTDGQPAFSQLGGSALVEAGVDRLPTTLGSLIGAEGDLAVGATQSEVYSGGAVRDRRKPDDPDQSTPRAWAHVRFAARFKVSPLHVTPGGVGFRLGLLGGLALDLDGSHSWQMSGAWTVGAQGLISGEDVSLLVSWVWAPPQGGEFRLTRHTLTAHLSLGPLMLGGRWMSDTVAQFTTARPTTQLPGTLQSSAFIGFVGYIL